MLDLFLTLALSITPTAQNPPSIAEIEKAALDARLAIRTMYVRMKVTSTDLVRPERSQIGVRTVWLDGIKIRGEIVREQGPSGRFVSCRNCEKEGFGITWRDQPGMIAQQHAIGTPGKPDFYDAIDPRVLGYTTMWCSGLRAGEIQLDRLVGSTDRDEPTVASERLNGVDCWVLRWTKKSGVKATVWIAPARGNNVVRIKIESPSGPVTMESDGFKKGKSGLWFPSSVIREDRESDGKLVHRESIEIQEVTTNEPIDPSVFTLAGLNIPEGTFVQTPDPKKDGHLQNGKIDTSKPTTRFEDTTVPEPTPLNPPRSVNYWLVAVCAVFVLAAVAVIVFHRRAAPQ